MDAERSEGREIMLVRGFDAPRELVWDAWTQPQHVGQWWGPNGFTTTTHEIDVTPGGVWRFIMHGPDGTDYPNKIVFREVTKPERLAYDHCDDRDEPLIHFTVRITFEEEGSGTKLTMVSTFPDEASRRKVEDEHGAFEGAIQHLQRLREYLTTMEVSHV